MDQKRFIVIAFPRRNPDNAEPKALPTFIWGHDNYAPGVIGKWIEMDEARERNRHSEQHVWSMTSAEACAVRDAAVRHQLSDDYVVHLLSAAEAPACGTLERRAA